MPEVLKESFTTSKPHFILLLFVSIKQNAHIANINVDLISRSKSILIIHSSFFFYLKRSSLFSRVLTISFFFILQIDFIINTCAEKKIKVSYVSVILFYIILTRTLFLLFKIGISTSSVVLSL